MCFILTVAKGAYNNLYQPPPASLTVTDQTDCRLIVHLVSTIIKKLWFYKLYHRFPNELIRNLGLLIRNAGLPI